MPLADCFANKPALVVYVTCGDPDLDTSRDVILAAVDAGADVIELGVPFSDPVADGPVIQRAMDRACRNHVSLRHVIDLAAEVKSARPQAGLVVFSYLNPILRYGMKRFAGDAKQAGVDAVLCTDMTVEESAEYVQSMRGHGLDTVFLAAPTSTDERLRRIADAGSGFVYAVSRLGVTGARSDVSTDARSLVERIKRVTSLPVAVGFGVSSREQFRAVGEYADAVVIGSAIVSIIEREHKDAPTPVAEFVRTVKAGSAAVLGV